jgi:hypothetical protein
MNIFKTTKLRFVARAGGPNETPNWLSRIKWAIWDGAKFRILLSRHHYFRATKGPDRNLPQIQMARRCKLETASSTPDAVVTTLGHRYLQNFVTSIFSQPSRNSSDKREESSDFDY